MFQNFLRSAISLLILTIAGLSAAGMLWWRQPPEKLASYESGGQVILGLLIVAALAGLWFLWSPDEKKHA